MDVEKAEGQSRDRDKERMDEGKKDKQREAGELSKGGNLPARENPKKTTKRRQKTSESM